MKDKHAALLFFVILFASFTGVGLFSFKNLCGFEEKYLLGGDRLAECKCLGVINMVESETTNKYYCTGLNLSYHHKYMEPIHRRGLIKVYASKAVVPINNKPQRLPSDLQACTTDEECILVKNSCGANCSGGGTDFDLAINRKYHVTWLTKLDCADVESVVRSGQCPLAKAVCADRRCTAVTIDINTYFVQ